MPLLTVVEQYVIAAMHHAEAERLENDIIGATIPECPGVIAFGVDAHECAAELYARLADWVKVSLTRGNPLPVIEGINLNTDIGQILVTYHRDDGTIVSGEIFADKDALEAALDARGRSS